MCLLCVHLAGVHADAHTGSVGAVKWGQLSPRSGALLPAVWNGQERGHTRRVRKASEGDLAESLVRKGKGQNYCGGGAGLEQLGRDNKSWRPAGVDMLGRGVKNDTDFCAAT